MAQPARYTQQQVIMVSQNVKANIKAAAEQGEVSDSEVCRRWLAVGMTSDPAVTMGPRMARVAEIEAELSRSAVAARMDQAQP